MKNSFVLLHINNIQILDQFYMVGPQSLSAGGPAVAVSGKTCSAVPGRASIVADGSTKATSFAAQAAHEEAHKIYVLVIFLARRH